MIIVREVIKSFIILVCKKKDIENDIQGQELCFIDLFYGKGNDGLRECVIVIWIQGQIYY